MRDEIPNEWSPKPRLKRRTASPWLVMPLAALTLALSVGVAFKYRQLRQLDQVAHSRLASTEALAPPVAGERLADSLLTDSILSIIQSYYVDPARVDNRGLLETALAALAANPRVKVGTSSGGIWVEIDGNRRLYPVKEKPRYQEVLDIFASLGRQLEDAGIVLAGADSPEKNAPGNVLLLNALLAELDAHSALLSPEAYRELRQGTDGSFGGLGVLVGIRENLLTVIKPLPNSPAARAGIKRHDRILGIDGTFTYGYTLDDLVEFMRGEAGSNVQLSVLRDGAHAPSVLSMKREVIHVDSVTAEEIDHHGVKILHLTIENFASRTSREVLSAIKKFRAKHGNVGGLVLDLRSNPGGLLDQAVQVADMFLRSGVIVTTRGRRDEVETAGGGYGEVGYPIALLIDGDSASASEIVAGALQDHQRAVVIGQPSFGKGSVQTIFELPSERALKLTIARYYTPADRSIQNVGIIPDVWLQPVTRTAANDNLFGPFRYKNERFLLHHLNNVMAAPVPVVPSTEVRPVTAKGYYLAAPKSDDGDEASRQDPEMEMALKVIDKVHETYGDNMPESAEKASQWLTLAKPAIDDSVAKMDKETSAYLKKTFKIAWQPNAAATSVAADGAVSLTLAPENRRDVTPGETLAIGWQVANTTGKAVNRASLFVRSEAPGFETKEVLLGELPAGATRRGTLDVQVPSYWEAGPLNLRVGVAVDAWPAPAAAADYPLSVKPRPVAQLTATTELVSAPSGSTLAVLTSRDKAQLKIDLTNTGTVTATAVALRVINLAGSQVEVPAESVKVGELKAGEHRELLVDVKAARTIYTPELAFGLFVESQDLKLPFRQRFTVKGQPNADVSAKGVSGRSEGRWDQPGLTSH